MRIGAVSYLNTKPLIWDLPQRLPTSELVLDLPSRLADELSAGDLDVALVPSIELALHPEWSIASTACIGSRGPVLSVKLLFRRPPSEVESIALDEGSRTSVALALILIAEEYGVHPRTEVLPIGAVASDTSADAVLMIGDRAICAADGEYCEMWDLGERWRQWTKLPFVFAMWAARRGIDAIDVEADLNAARDAGCRAIDEIAEVESRAMKLPRKLVASYLRDNLNFYFDDAERAGLKLFFQKIAQHELIPHLPEIDFNDRSSLHR